MTLIIFCLTSLNTLAQQDLIRPLVGDLVVHTVQEGEDLYTIAADYSLAVDHLAFANGFSTDARYIQAGREIIVPVQRILPANPPRNGLVLNLPERGIYLFQDGQFKKFYPCSIGDQIDFRTPSGQYAIIEKMKDPTWYPPDWAEDTTPVPPGPDNPLGDRWIGLSLHSTGIHGTNEPENIGNSVTHGCIRTYPHQLHELYDIVQVGWPVRLDYETVKFAYDQQGQLMVASFPDVYDKINEIRLTERALEKLEAFEDITQGNLKNIIQLGLGFPVYTKRQKTLIKEVQERASQRSLQEQPED